MSKGKPWRIGRHTSEVIRHIESIERKAALYEYEIVKRLKTKDKRPTLSVSERIRFKRWLWWKYGPECSYCQRFYDWRQALTIDHIQPLSRGGALKDIRNMALACRSCNKRKGNQWLEA